MLLRQQSCEMAAGGSGCGGGGGGGSELSFSISRILAEEPAVVARKPAEWAEKRFAQAPSAFISILPLPVERKQQSDDSAARADSVVTLQLPRNPSGGGGGSPFSSIPEARLRFWQDRYVTGCRRVGHPYSSRAPARSKKCRTSFNKAQVTQLEGRFTEQKYLASSERADLARSLNMSDAQVKTWFQNRRTKWRRQASEEREFERRSSSFYSGSLYIPSVNQTPAYVARPDVTI